MIDLSKLTHEERKNIIRGCEPFPTMRYTNVLWIKPIVKVLLEEIGDVVYEPELKLILTAASKAKRHNLSGSQFSMSEKGFAHANRLTKQKNSIKRMRKLLKIMEGLDYLTYLRGFNIKNTVSCKSYLRFSPRLLKLLDKSKCDKFGMKREDMDIVEVVDVEKTKTTRGFNKKGVFVKTKNVILKPTQQIRGIGALKKDLKAYNTLLERQLITYKDDAVIALYKRRFEGDLLSCGRYYTIGGLQGEDKNYRNTIKINGKATCEIDVRGIQPRSLLVRKGIVLPEDYDPYKIGIVPRDFAKTLLFPVLFSNSRKDAKTSITTKLKAAGIKDITSEEVINAFENHNKEIKDCFYNKYQYRELQYLDSSIAEFVINYFTSKSVPLLSWHDSWIIESIYKEELIKVIKAAWLEVMGTSDNCYLDVEYDNSK